MHQCRMETHHVLPDTEDDCRPVAGEDRGVICYRVNALLQPGVAKWEGLVTRKRGFDIIWSGCE